MTELTHARVGYEGQWGDDKARDVGPPIPQLPSIESCQWASASPQTPIITRVPRGPPPVTPPKPPPVPPLSSDEAIAGVAWLRKALNATFHAVRPEDVSKHTSPLPVLDPSSGFAPCIAGDWLAQINSAAVWWSEVRDRAHELRLVLKTSWPLKRLGKTINPHVTIPQP